MTGVAYALAFLADAQMQRGDLEAAAETLAKLGALPEAARDHWYYYDARGRLRFSRAATARRSRSSTRRDGSTRRSAAEPRAGRVAIAGCGSRISSSARRRGGPPAAEEVEVASGGAHRGRSPRRSASRAWSRRQGEPAGLVEAVELLDGSRATLERARGLLELGSALRRTNQRSEAREYLRQAVELAHAGESPALAERAQTELMATGARPRRIALSGLESPTPSERRVAGWPPRR